MKCILIQRKLHFICPCADNNIASLIADYAASSVASLRLPPVPRNLAIPITVRQLQRHLELEERGLSLPSSPRVVWPLFSAELFAPELGPMVGSLPSVIPICVFPYLSVDNHASLQQAHPRFHPLWGTLACSCLVPAVIDVAGSVLAKSHHSCQPGTHRPPRTLLHI